jgi:hypothetical protein
MIGINDGSTKCYTENPLVALIFGKNTGPLTAFQNNALDLVERKLIAPAIVELRRACRGVVCHALRILEAAAVREKCRDAGTSTSMTIKAGARSTSGCRPQKPKKRQRSWRRPSGRGWNDQAEHEPAARHCPALRRGHGSVLRRAERHQAGRDRRPSAPRSQRTSAPGVRAAKPRTSSPAY